jgi:general secretion pathway protein H
MPRRRCQGGFSLIEMIVVMAILGLVAGLVVARPSWHNRRLDAEAALRALTDTLRLARARALAQDHPVSVEVTGRSFAADGAASYALPDGVRLSPARITFSPDGGSTGGGIMLSVGDDRYDISVNWLTGRVLRSGPTHR